MTALTPTHSISVKEPHAELRFAIAGFWTCEAMEGFLYDLGNAAKPFMRSGIRFSVIGDLRGFVAQDQATAEAIRQSLLLAQKNGMKRFALIADSSLVKMQYRRITAGLEADFFEAPAEAEEWLRSCRKAEFNSDPSPSL